MRLLVEHLDVSTGAHFVLAQRGHTPHRGEGRMRAKRKPVDQNREFAFSDQVNSRP